MGAINAGMENTDDNANVMQDSFDHGFMDSGDDEDDGGDEETDNGPVKDSMETDMLGEQSFVHSQFFDWHPIALQALEAQRLGYMLSACSHTYQLINIEF